MIAPDVYTGTNKHTDEPVTVLWTGDHYQEVGIVTAPKHDPLCSPNDLYPDDAEDEFCHCALVARVRADEVGRMEVRGLVSSLRIKQERDDLREQVQAMRRARPYYGHYSWITTDAYNEALNDVLALLGGGSDAVEPRSEWPDLPVGEAPPLRLGTECDEAPLSEQIAQALTDEALVANAAPHGVHPMIGMNTHSAALLYAADVARGKHR